jgi:hypothetical protein
MVLTALVVIMESVVLVVQPESVVQPVLEVLLAALVLEELGDNLVVVVEVVMVVLMLQ